MRLRAAFRNTVIHASGRHWRLGSLALLALMGIPTTIALSSASEPAFPVDPSVAFHLAEHAPAPELVEMPYWPEAPTSPMLPPASGRNAYLHPEPIVRAGDISHVQQTLHAQPAVEIVLTAGGAERLATATTDNVGRQMAIIAHGQVLTVATIAAPIPDGRLTLSADTLSDAAALVGRMRTAREPGDAAQ